MASGTGIYLIDVSRCVTVLRAPLRHIADRRFCPVCWLRRGRVRPFHDTDRERGHFVEINVLFNFVGSLHGAKIP